MNPTVKPPRYKIDAVIALAVLVLLLLLWRLVNRPTMLGAAGSTIVTNVFGPFGVRLAQSFGGAGGAGEIPGNTNVTTEPPANAAPTNAAAPPALSSNQPPAASNLPGADDSIITNRPLKAIVISPTDFSYTNEPIEGAANSGDAPAMARRLEAVGAKSGDLQFSLSWNNFNDLDLHCVDPRGVEIWYENTSSIATGGQLDHDANANQYTDSPVENIFWPAGGAPPGIYDIFVVHFANHGGQDPTRFTVRVLVKGQTNYFTHFISYTGRQEKNWICTIKYDPANPDPSKQRVFLSPGQGRR